MSYLEILAYPIRKVGNRIIDYNSRITRRFPYLKHFEEEFRPSARAEGICVGTIEIAEVLFAPYASSVIGSTILKHLATTTVGGTIGAGIVGTTFLGDRILSENSREYKYSYFSTELPKAFWYDAKRMLRSSYVGIRYGISGLFRGSVEEKREMRQKARSDFKVATIGEAAGITFASLIADIGIHRLLEDYRNWESWFLLPIAWLAGTFCITGAKAWDSYSNWKKSQ